MVFCGFNLNTYKGNFESIFVPQISSPWVILINTCFYISHGTCSSPNLILWTYFTFDIGIFNLCVTGDYIKPRDVLNLRLKSYSVSSTLSVHHPEFHWWCRCPKHCMLVLHFIIVFNLEVTDNLQNKVTYWFIFEKHSISFCNLVSVSDEMKFG